MRKPEAEARAPPRRWTSQRPRGGRYRSGTLRTGTRSLRYWRWVLATSSLAAQTAIASGVAVSRQPTPTTTAPLLQGRFVRLSNPAVGCLNITEIQVYSQPGGANLAAGKPVSKSSGYPPGADINPGSMAVDGDFGTYTQTSCVEAPWLMVDLGAVIPIYSVAVYNRMDNNCGTRTTGSVVSVLDGSGTTLYTSAPFPDKQGNTTATNACGTILQPYGTFFVLPPNPAVNGQ